MLKKTKKFIGKFFQIIFKILNIILIGFTLFLAFAAIFKPEWIEKFIEWMKVQVEILGYWNYVIAGTSAGIEAIPILGVMLPGQNILLLVGGFFGSVSFENILFLVLIASIGGIIGNYIGYFLGIKYGDHFFEKYGMWFGIGKTELKYLEKGIKKWGPLGIVLGKFYPLTRSFLPFIAGSMKMKMGLFMFYNAIGSVIYAIVIVGIGVFFVENYKIILEYIGHIMLGIFALVGLYIYLFKRDSWKKYMKEKEKEVAEIELNLKKKFKK